MTTTTATPHRPPSSRRRAPQPIEHIAIICSKGTLDMAYPGLILANAARMTGIDATLFFTFWGLDIITEKKRRQAPRADRRQPLDAHPDDARRPAGHGDPGLAR